MMYKTGQVVTISLIALVVGGVIGWYTVKPYDQTKLQTYLYQIQKTATTTPAITASQVELKMAMRKLWEEHVLWTRMAILSIVNKSMDKDLTIKRLLKNSDDMSMALKSFYSGTDMDKLSTLLREHLTIAADLVTNAAKGNTIKAAEAEKLWYANADQLSTTLSMLNPNMKMEEVQKMFYEHLKLTKAEAVARISRNYNADIMTYDQIQDQALMMADALSGGLIAQFPDRFNK